MRRILTALAGLALVVGGWSHAPAQEAEYSAPEYEGPMYREIITFDVPPGEAAAFEMAGEKIVEAAKQAGLSSDYGWLFVREGSDFTLVFPVKSMAYFDDEEQWMRQFEGTPGEQTLGEAFAAFSELNYSSHSHVLRLDPEHSYRPANPIEKPSYVRVFRNWVRPGQQEAHSENTKALMKIISEVDFPYEVMAQEGVIGDGGLRVYVVPFDDMISFLGDNSLEAHLAAHERGEEWGALIGERMKMLRDSDNFDAELVPGMSYMPAAETAQAGGCK